MKLAVAVALVLSTIAIALNVEGRCLRTHNLRLCSPTEPSRRDSRRSTSRLRVPMGVRTSATLSSGFWPKRQRTKPRRPSCTPVDSRAVATGAAKFSFGPSPDVSRRFDEADSLFAKRTEVRTSVDRYANLAVNYMLQRLDSFEGIAILTTNLAGSIDKAFRRRMSLRLTFPFPDETMRAKLWAAHLPDRLPRAGTLDLAHLASEYRMSGGYIRNAALRAAFLAAEAGHALTQDHLERAIRLEYREIGKLTAGGALE